MTHHDGGPGLLPGASGLSPTTEPPDVPSAEAADVDRLRADLQGWTVDTVHALLGDVAQAALAREQAVPAVRALEGHLDDPHAALTLAFVLGRPVPRRRLASALPELGVEGAVRMGLLEPAGRGERDAVRARVDLRPYAAVDAAGTADWWVVSDLGEVATGRPLPPDHVLGVGGASVTLARCTIRTPVARALDVGTGCGVQALHATPARGRRRRHRRLGPRARLRPPDPRPQRRARRRPAPGRPARARPRRGVRPRGQQPPVRHHPADAVRAVVHLPGRRAPR